MNELGRLRIWEDPAILTALSWYLDVAENRRPAKFRIAATLATELDPAESSEEALWAELDRLTPVFLARWDDPRRRTVASESGRAEPARALPRTCLPHARPLQFLSMGLPC
jgi:hypothetical protein